MEIRLSPNSWSYRNPGSESAVGPISESEFVKRLKDGSINRESLVMSATRTKGKWVQAGKVPAIAKLIQPEQVQKIEIAASSPKRKPAGQLHSAERILKGFLPLESRSKPTIWLLRITMLVMAINCGGIWLLCQDGFREHRSLLAVTNIVVFAIQSILFVTTAVFFLRWKYRAYKNLQVACEEPLSTTAGWSCAVYFIPILNIFRPAMAMHELQARSKANIGVSVYAWWILWFIGGIIANATLRNSTGRFDQRFFNVTLLNVVVLVIAGFLLLKIIKTVTEKQRRYRASLQSEIG